MKSADVVELYPKTNDQMAGGGFNMRKWLTNDSQVRARIEIDAKADSAPVREEDITYAKLSVGLRLGCKGQKVLGLAWDYEVDVISFDLTETAEHTRGLTANRVKKTQRTLDRGECPRWS